VCARIVSNSLSLSLSLSVSPLSLSLPPHPPSLSVTDGGHMCSPNAEELTLLIAQQVVALRRVQGYLGQENSSDLRVLDNSMGMCAICVYTYICIHTLTRT